MCSGDYSSRCSACGSNTLLNTCFPACGGANAFLHVYIVYLYRVQWSRVQVLPVCCRVPGTETLILKWGSLTLPHQTRLTCYHSDHQLSQVGFHACLCQVYIHILYVVVGNMIWTVIWALRLTIIECISLHTWLLKWPNWATIKAA